MEPRFPILGTDILDFGILEGVEASQIGDEIIPVTDKKSRPGLHLLSHLLRIVCLVDLPSPAEKVDQGEIGDVLGVGIGMALTPLDGVEIEAGLEFFYEPALAGSRITNDGEDRSLALPEIGDGLLQLGHLHLPADQLGS